MPELLHNFVHNLTCPHCWQMVAAGVVGSFAVCYGAARVFCGRFVGRIAEKARSAWRS